MNIAINTRLLIENELEGIGRFSFEIVFDQPFGSKFDAFLCYD